MIIIMKSALNSLNWRHLAPETCTRLRYTNPADPRLEIQSRPDNEGPGATTTSHGLESRSPLTRHSSELPTLSSRPTVCVSVGMWSCGMPLASRRLRSAATSASLVCSLTFSPATSFCRWQTTLSTAAGVGRTHRPSSSNSPKISPHDGRAVGSWATIRAARRAWTGYASTHAAGNEPSRRSRPST